MLHFSNKNRKRHKKKELCVQILRFYQVEKGKEFLYFSKMFFYIYVFNLYFYYIVASNNDMDPTAIESRSDRVRLNAQALQWWTCNNGIVAGEEEEEEVRSRQKERESQKEEEKLSESLFNAMPTRGTTITNPKT